MNLPSQSLLRFALPAAAFAAMAALGWKAAAPPDASSALNELLSGKSMRVMDRAILATRRQGIPEEVRRCMDTIRNASTPEARAHATIELASAIPTGEIRAWLESSWFDVRGGMELTLFNKIVIDRWLAEEPQAVIAWGLKTGRKDTAGMLAEWGARDPVAMRAYFKDHPDFHLQLDSFAALAVAHPAEVLEGLADLAKENTTPQAGFYCRDLMEALAKSDSAGLEALVPALAGRWREAAEAAIFSGKLNTGFPAAIRDLWSRPDGWQIYQNTRMLNSARDGMMLAELDNLPDEWRKQLAGNPGLLGSGNCALITDAQLRALGCDSQQVHFARLIGVNAMSMTDPEKAIQTLTSMDLSPQEKKSVFSDVLWRYTGDPSRIESLVAMFPSEDDRKVALEAVERAKIAENPSAPIPTADWLAKAQSLADSGGDGYRYMAMLEHWDKDQLAELNASFRALPQDQKLKTAAIIAAAGSNYQSIDTGLQGDAIKVLLEHPDGVSIDPHRRQSPAQVASMFVVKLAQNDPVGAGQWVDSLPEGKGKSFAAKNLATAWIQYDPEGLESWLNSQPASAGKEIREHLEKAGKF